jgi:hypothetical protein
LQCLGDSTPPLCTPHFDTKQKTHIYVPVFCLEKGGEIFSSESLLSTCTWFGQGSAAKMSTTGKPAATTSKTLDSKLKAQREELQRRKEALLAKKAAVASYSSSRGQIPNAFFCVDMVSSFSFFQSET